MVWPFKQAKSTVEEGIELHARTMKLFIDIQKGTPFVGYLRKKPTCSLYPHPKFIDLKIWKATKFEESFDSSETRQLFEAKQQIVELNRARVEKHLEGFTTTQRTVLDLLPSDFMVLKGRSGWRVLPQRITQYHIAKEYEELLNETT